MRIATFDRIVQVKRSLFGLPYTLAGALLPFALGSAPQVPAGRWAWIVLAFLSLRFAGMAFNHTIDRQIDAKNPRTAKRPLPLMEAMPKDVNRMAWGCIALFVLSCAMINWVVLALAPLVALVTWAYAYTKRFTSLCHFVVGAVLMMGPVMGYAAISGELAWAPALLGLTALLAIVGNDIIYSMQDLNFDRAEGLHSLPVRVGPMGALMIARLCFSGAVVAMTAAGWMAQLPIPYYLGPLAACFTVLHYDRVLLKGNIEIIPMAFFRCNALLSLWALVGTVGALLWHIWL